MSVSLLALTRLVAEDEGLGYAQFAPSTGGTTTTIVSTAGGGPFDADDPSNLFANAWAKVEADSAVTPLNVGEVRRVDATGYTPGTGTLTTRAFSNATTTTMTVGCYFGLPPSRHSFQKGITNYVNEVLRLLYRKDLYLITLATDGDMETSGVTNWSVTNATREKVATGNGVTQGDQALEVTCTGALGYATMASALDVSEGEAYEIVADCMPTTGSAQLQAWDVTNDEEIKITTAYAGSQARRLWLNLTVPADCEQINARLIGVGASDVVVWDNLSVRHYQASRFKLPSWLTDPDWLEEVWVYRPGSLRDNAYAIDERLRRHPSWFDVQEDHTANSPYELELPERFRVPGASHMFIQAIRPYAELATDAATTDADQDWVKAWTLARIYADKAMGGSKEYSALAQKWIEEANRLHGLKGPQVERRPMQRW